MRCARAGDHTLRAQWNSRDEIGRLVTAFNEMLSQLDRDRPVAAGAGRQRPRGRGAARIGGGPSPSPMVVTSIPEHEVLHSNAPAAHWLGGRKTDPWAVGLEPGRARARFFQRLADQGSVDEFEVRWKGSPEPLVGCAVGAAPAVPGARFGAHRLHAHQTCSR